MLDKLFHNDRFMRIPIVLFTGFFFVREIASLYAFLQHPSFFLDNQFMSALMARISLIAFLGLLVFFHFTRSQPINQATGWQPKISALLGLTLGNLLLLLNRAPLPPMMDVLSATFLIVGNYLCIVTLLHLGRSISIMAEARQLVTGEPIAW